MILSRNKTHCRRTGRCRPRLGYNLRLEVKRVFKLGRYEGPSLDPHGRLLAEEVEDHPLDYGDFEAARNLSLAAALLIANRLTFPSFPGVFANERSRQT